VLIGRPQPSLFDFYVVRLDRRFVSLHVGTTALTAAVSDGILVFGWFDSRLERFGFHFVRIEDRFACRDVELPPVPRTANDPSRPDPLVLTGAVRFRGAAEFPLTERCALVWAVVFIA